MDPEPPWRGRAVNGIKSTRIISLSIWIIQLLIIIIRKVDNGDKNNNTKNRWKSYEESIIKIELILI